MGKEDRSPYVDNALRQYKKEADLGVRLVKFSEGEADIYDIQPREVTALPVLLVQGWGANVPRYRKMQTISEAGHRVIAVHPRPFGIDSQDERRVRGAENARMARIYLQVLKEKDIESINAIAVSGGTAPTLKAASLEPSLFDSMVLVTPGLNGPIGKFELAKRFLGRNPSVEDMNLRDRHVDMSALQAGVEFALHLIANPRRRVREVRDMSEVDAYALCREVAAKGVKISAICARDDTVFPLSEIYENFENAKDANGNTFPSPFFKIHEVDGKHEEISVIRPTRIEDAVGLLRLMSDA